METKTTDTPILAILREMEVGDTHEFPVSRRGYITSAMTRFGLDWNKKFKSVTNRETRTLTVTRIS